MAPKMEYTRLGNSGLKVSKIILGCMSYGDPDWMSWVLPEDKAIEHIKFAYVFEHGITTFDTADVYSNGLSEIILGNAIKKLGLPRDELVIMTKLYAPVAPEFGQSTFDHDPLEFGIVNQIGLNRKHIFDGVKASLKRLQLDYIDVLQCHRFDYNTPIEETMQALHDLVQAGLVRYIGMSSCYAYQFHQMQNYALAHHLTPFISMQNHYSLIYREEEREMFPTLGLFGVGSIPWSPLARGLLSKPLGEQTKRSSTDNWIDKYGYKSEGTTSIVNRVEEVAKKRGVSMSRVALAWVLSKPGVTAPIIGTTSLANLEDSIGALEVTLSEEEVKYLEEAYRPLGIIGHE
ncbi:Aldo/keto reductase [Trametes elegans]|nr:Aldo/keto reductase [Trametes elegans]